MEEENVSVMQEDPTDELGDLSVLNANANEEFADRMIANRIKPGTRTQYLRKKNIFMNWLQLKEEELMKEDGSLEANWLVDFETRRINYGRIPVAYLTQFFSHICKKPPPGSNSVRKRIGNYQTFEHVSGYKSAILSDMRLQGHELGKRDLNRMGDWFAGYKRLIAEQKQEGLMEVGEGKGAFSFSVYRFLGKLSFSNMVTYAHLFLLLCWNLIARCCSVSNLSYHHVSWRDDAMIIVFPSHKGDEEGAVTLPKHVYGNRFVLIWHLLCTSLRLDLAMVST